MKSGLFGMPEQLQILNIKAIYLDWNNSNEVSPWVSKKAVKFMESDTDWIGPYYVKSLSSDETGEDMFTGGWHEISGNATAKTDQVSVKVGGQKLLNNRVYEGTVEITAMNYIKACNTMKSGKYVLREEVDYIVTPLKIDVEVETTALEDVALLKYYGMQTQNKPWDGSVRYGNGVTSNYGENSNSGSGEEGITDKFTLISKDYRYRLTAKIDTGYGMGTFEYLNENQPAIFTEAYGKTYFNLINGKKKIIEKDSSVAWKGFYLFG